VSGLEIRPVRGRRDRRLFWEIPSRLHAKDAAFIPQLDAALSAILDRRKNPYWKHVAGQEWIALEDGVPVGRVGACRDEDMDGLGTLGFLDCRDDVGTARALFDTAEAWLANRGCKRARGPLNYSVHDTGGVLVEGFDTPPTIDTTWNPSYYDALYQRCGWAGAKDLLAAAGGQMPAKAPERAQRFAAIAERRGLKTRPFDLSRFDEEAEAFRQIYNAAWEDNWGHVPIGRDDFAYKAKDFKIVMDPDLVLFVEHEGKPVGLLFGLPDLNVPIARSRGRLLPFGWWRLLRARKTVHRARVIAMGVLPGFRRRGAEAYMLREGFRQVAGRYEWAEASWVLADNGAMLNGLALYGLHPYKRWRLYEKKL